MTHSTNLHTERREVTAVRREHPGEQSRGRPLIFQPSMHSLEKSGAEGLFLWSLASLVLSGEAAAAAAAATAAVLSSLHITVPELLQLITISI